MGLTYAASKTPIQEVEKGGYPQDRKMLKKACSNLETAEPLLKPFTKVFLVFTLRKKTSLLSYDGFQVSTLFEFDSLSA